MHDFETQLRSWQSAVETFLDAQFRETPPHKILLEAMRYSLLAGGKRLRPILCMAFCEACGGNPEDALPAGAAIEMVHTYSLIHDDLPCMDNDDYRRGRLTSHKVYGEDVATLTGDALLTAAFRYLSEMEAEPAAVVRCTGILARAAGENGMVAGQILDLEGEKRTLSQEELRRVHRHKTGDMIAGACQIGAVLGKGTEAQISAAGEFGYALGMAFQIRDDMLDCMGTREELGKPIGSDAENGKSTFVTLVGLEECQNLVEQETNRALDILDHGDFLETDFLRELSRSLTARRK